VTCLFLLWSNKNWNTILKIVIALENWILISKLTGIYNSKQWLTFEFNFIELSYKLSVTNLLRKILIMIDLLFLVPTLSRIIILVLISLVYYIYYKLTFWKRQNIPNIVSHSANAFQNYVHLADQNCIQKYGNIVGFVINFN